jgi:uncharacterized protein YyaL (SSP411 family)
MEASPYLLQHAKNPVDWFPWGPEALAKAKAEDRPILLSIGYSACHWCHVMERESFEDAAIARRMNELFVNIKVDREERPDLDQVYQLVVQLMGRSGGWPLTVFLTPEQRPFFAGTYFPPTERYGMPSFPMVLDAVADAYRNRRSEVDLQADELTQAIGRVQRVADRDKADTGRAALGPDLLRIASRKLSARFDEQHGGFGKRPKFPNTMALDVLLRRGALEKDEVCLASVQRALDRMRAGGIWDHLRGGFHRYSTDEKWLVPHFEKMLYDNALLLRLYVDGYRVFGDPAYAETAREIVGYLFADMRDATGAFYSAEDADSEGVEGKYFVWTLDELRAAVGDDTLAYDVARLYFDITEHGNFEETGATVLSAARGLDRVAVSLGERPSAVAEALDRAKAKMLAARDKRVRPSRDDKVLASWNGLLVSALADAGRALGEPTWVEAAASAFGALKAALIRGGRVGRYLKDGNPSAGPGFLDDQAYVGNAALDLYEATADPLYITAARRITDEMIAHFWSADERTFYFTPDDGPELITRTKDVFDHAVPSATSMAALLCLRLGSLVDVKYLEPAEAELHALAPNAAEDAFALGQTVCVLDRLVRGPVDVALVGDVRSPLAKELSDKAFVAYLPNRSIAAIDPTRAESIEAAKLVYDGKTAPAGGAVAAYVCQDRACSAPVTTASELEALLKREKG